MPAMQIWLTILALAGAGAHPRDGAPEGLGHRLDGVEDGLFAAAHDGQRAIHGPAGRRKPARR